ncbi:MAG: HxsD-like protein [Candidatus Omnitrophota bacterium]|nr:HxsD-like protein [Candidatus Omnitrophota bacterium]
MHIYLNSSIYNLAAIKKAMQGYSGIVKTGLARQGHYYRVKFEHADSHDLSALKDEFVNYCLGMTKKCL